MFQVRSPATSSTNRNSPESLFLGKLSTRTSWAYSNYRREQFKFRHFPGESDKTGERREERGEIACLINKTNDLLENYIWKYSTLLWAKTGFGGWVVQQRKFPCLVIHDRHFKSTSTSYVIFLMWDHHGTLWQNVDLDILLYWELAHLDPSILFSAPHRSPSITAIETTYKSYESYERLFVFQILEKDDWSLKHLGNQRASHIS